MKAELAAKMAKDSPKRKQKKGLNVDFNDSARLAQRSNTSLPPVSAGTLAVAAQLTEDSAGGRRQPNAVFNATVRYSGRCLGDQ